MVKHISLSLLLFVSSQVCAEHSYFFDEKDDQFDLGYHLAENAYGFLPVPVLITEPAVGVGGGLVGLFLHESDEEKELRRLQALEAIDGGAQLMPAAMTLVGAGGTANGTWFALAGHRHSWLRDSIRYTTVGGAANGNLDIYTRLGGLLPPAHPIQFDTSTEALFAMQKVQFRVTDTPLMLGMKQLWSQSSISSSNPVVDKILQNTLGDKTITSGLGLIAEYDTRDNMFFPKKGYTLSAEYMVYDDVLGSDNDYQTLAAAGEVYVPLFKQWTFALAGSFDKLYAGDSQLSPTTQPYVNLRGVSAYRYQGDQVATVQSQLMYHIDHRWTLSAFYGHGSTHSDAIEQSDDSVSAYGIGFRYQIARRYGIHMGVDVASSGDENAIYFKLGSGF